MPIKVEISTDISDVQRLLHILSYAESTIIPREVRLSVKRMEQFSKKLIRTGTRTGKHYWGLPKRSSAPGEAPKSQTGYLASSIKSSFNHSRKAGVAQGVVGASAPHALWLEHGAERKNNTLKPRPFFKPTIEHEIPILIENIVDALF